MANPLYNNSVKQPDITENLINMINSAKQGNPKTMIEQMVKGNPQMAQTLQMIMQGGQNPTQLMMSMLQQRGIDPNRIINAMKH